MAKPKLFCTRLQCDDPFCDRRHHYECVICFAKVDEDEAVWTRFRGYAHAACLLQDEEQEVIELKGEQ